jgi:hypothetical protein
MRTRRLVVDSGVQVLHVDHIDRPSPEAVLLLDLVVYVRENKNK